MIKYDKYKPSEIRWLGNIPEHWKITRIKNKGTVNGRVGWKALKASEYVNDGYFFLSTPNIKNTNIDFENVNYITAGRYFESPEIMLGIGDILLVKDGSTLGIVNIIRTLPSSGTVNSSIAILRLKGFDSYYGYYLLLSNFIQNNIQLKKDGMGVPHLFQRDIINFDIIEPSATEQTQIANYLDAKTQALDKKIKLLTQKVNNYKEYRKSLINETVCKGLDKNVKLKDSGIDWIGQIPEHWDIVRLKSLGNIETSSVNKKIEENEDLVKLVNYTDVYGNSKKEIWNDDNYMVVSANIKQSQSKFLKKGDVLFTPSSETIEDIGVSAVVMENLDNTLYSYHLLRLRFSKNVFLNFKKYLFNNDFVQNYFSRSATGTTRKILGLSAYNNLLVIMPPTLKEQQEIANYLDQKTQIIDKIVSNINTQISTLKELRKTLINDAVTGKIKVSN
jgi:type I restriction enzyme, S subunit